MEIQRTEMALFKVPVPWLLGICFDCTVSISETDFRTAQQELVNFILNVHRRATFLPQLPSDFISVTAFKDKNKIFGPSAPLNVVKMDRQDHVVGLCQWINSLKRDGASTALYDAIAIASQELVTIDQRLPYQYLKVILAITDGEDNDSRTSLSNLNYFNSTNLNLAVIGVGNSTSSELRRLGQYATSVHSISRFADLYKAITISVRTVIERTQSIRF